jgi:hypothetical protein
VIPYWRGNSSRAVSISYFNRDDRPGVYGENGSMLNSAGIGGNSAMHFGAISLDWLTPADMGSTWLANDTPATRIQFHKTNPLPVPVAIVSVVAKSGQMLFDSSGGAAPSYTRDFRNRTWLHSPPTGLSTYLMNPNDTNRSSSDYQLHFTPVAGDLGVSQHIVTNGENAYFGGGLDLFNAGQTQVPALEIPSAPITNLASFAGMRIDHARAQQGQFFATVSGPAPLSMKHVAHIGGSVGPGIGNAYAHPMVAPAQAYTRNLMGFDNGHPNGPNYLSSGMHVHDDYWDHLFLANEGLWDSWFCSGIVPQMNGGTETTTRTNVAQNFFNGTQGLVSKRLQPHHAGKTPADLTSITSMADGWQKIAAHLLNAGQFNVNSTSVEAWKALLMSMRDRPIAIQNASTGARSTMRDPDNVVLSRFTLANSDQEGNDASDPNSWLGIRILDETQIQ